MGIRNKSFNKENRGTGSESGSLMGSSSSLSSSRSFPSKQKLCNISEMEEEDRKILEIFNYLNREIIIEKPSSSSRIHFHKSGGSGTANINNNSGSKKTKIKKNLFKIEKKNNHTYEMERTLNEMINYNYKFISSLNSIDCTDTGKSILESWSRQFTNEIKNNLYLNDFVNKMETLIERCEKSNSDININYN
jgi:hypothetical protein